jgi:hypothetical protein
MCKAGCFQHLPAKATRPAGLAVWRARVRLGGDAKPGLGRAEGAVLRLELRDAGLQRRNLALHVHKHTRARARTHTHAHAHPHTHTRTPMHTKIEKR